MDLSDTIARLSGQVATFETRVKGRQAVVQAADSGWDVPVPHAWVTFDGATAEDSNVAGNVSSSIDAVQQVSIAVIVVTWALENSEAGDGEVDAVPTTEAALLAALLGWRPSWAINGYRFVSTALVDLDRARVVYETRFRADRVLQSY